MAVNHQADIIMAFFGNGNKWNIKIDYSLEDKPLSTMAPLKLIEDLPENFLIMNGDILTDINYLEFYYHHIKNKNIFTISSYKREQKSEFGVLIKDENDKLIEFKEKPVTHYEVSMGIYMANKNILNYIPDGQSYGFDNLMIDLIKAGNPASLKKFEGYWLDIGKADDYLQAIDQFETYKDIFIK